MVPALLSVMIPDPISSIRKATNRVKGGFFWSMTEYDVNVLELGFLAFVSSPSTLSLL